MEDSKWNSRKFWMALTTLAFGFGAMWAPAEARERFYTFAEWIVPIYLGGQSLVDVAEKYTKKFLPQVPMVRVSKM